MYIDEITIQNFKSLKNLNLQLKPGVNLLIGDNGVGKTSVLDAVVVAMGGFFNGVNGISAKNILLEDIRIQTHSMGSVSAGIEYFVPVNIACKLQTKTGIFEWQRFREDEQPKRNTRLIRTQGDISKYAQNITNNMQNRLPVFSYQSSLRVAQTRRGDYGADIKNSVGDRRKGYLGCLAAVPDTKQIKNWCYQMQVLAFEQEQKIREYEAFKKLVGTFMQEMSGLTDMPKISYSPAFKDITYKEGNTQVPITYLSAGYQSLLWMVMDIAYRICVLNPGMDDLGETEGIVLIDEVDMHLHPKWQWKVIGALQKMFPNIQFIIATHSPIIISSCKNGNLMLIDHDQEVIYLNDTYGYSVNDVLELCQNSTDMLESVKNLKNEFEMALDELEFEKAGEIIDKMIAEVGAENTEVKKAKAALDTERLFEGD